MFNEYGFLAYCEEQYLSGLNQEDALEQRRAGTISETIRSMPAWDIVCWLAEYTERKQTVAPLATDGAERMFEGDRPSDWEMS